MSLQLSIFSFVRSQEMQFFFCKCIWSLELLTFRVFAKKRGIPLWIQTFFLNTLLRFNSGKQRLSPCTSSSVSSSDNPNRLFSSSSSPAFSSPGAVLPWVWGFSLRMPSLLLQMTWWCPMETVWFQPCWCQKKSCELEKKHHSQKQVSFLQFWPILSGVAI